MSKNARYCLILVLIGYFLFMFGNSIVSLTNPDEVFYTLTAKEMVKHHSWMTPFLFDQPQFEKPIFLYWLLRVSFLIFGMTAFAARFFPAFFGILGILGVYFLSLSGFKNERKAFVCALVLASCGLYIGLARTVFTDMIFSVWILLSLVSFFWGYSNTKHKNLSLILMFIAFALAVLSKGPLGFCVPFGIIVLFLLIKKEIRYLFSKSALFGFLIFLALSLPWYILMIKKYGNSFTREFFYNDHYRRLIEAEHLSNDTWYFYPMSMIGCLFPWSVFLLGAIFAWFRRFKEYNAKPIYLFSFCWLVVTFLVFQPAHSKLISYIFPLFPALSIITGDFIYNIAFKEEKSRQFRVLFLITWSILLLMPIGFIVASSKFASYLSSKLPVYAMVVLFLFWLAIMLYFILRRKYFRSVYALSCLVPIFLVMIPFVKNDIEPYVSSKSACEYLVNNFRINNTILASKFFLRGTRFYTEKNVAAFSPYGKNYFSPHPVLFLDSDEKARDFLNSQSETFMILKRNSVEDLERIAKQYGFKITPLKVIGDEHIVKVLKAVNPK